MQRFRKWYPIATGIYIASMILYVVVKAAHIPFTYDEAYSFNYFASMPVIDIMRSKAAFSLANNHMLNTLLMRGMMQFGTHPFLLRLPVMLAYVLFLWSCHKITQRWFTNLLLQLLFLLALTLNPMLPEFFALARGYGLGIGFLMYSLLQVTLLVQPADNRRKSVHLHLSLVAGILAVCSNFSFLLPVILLFLLAVVASYRRCSYSQAWKRAVYALLPVLVYAALLYKLIALPIRYLIAANAIYRGGSRNFIADTWTSIISDLLGCRSADFEVIENGGPDPASLTAWSMIGLALFVISLVIAGIGLARRYRSPEYWPVIIGFLLAVGCILGINAQFYIQHTPLITFRVALYLYPLIVLVPFAAIKVLSARQPRIATGGASALCLLLLVNFCIQLNITTTRDWRFDAFITRMEDYIVADKGPEPAKLMAYSLMVPALEFYTRTTYQQTIRLVPYDDSLLQHVPGTYDYIYFPRIRAGKLWTHYRLVQAYDDSTYLLFKHK